MIFPNKPGQKYSVYKSGEKYGKSNKETEFFVLDCLLRTMQSYNHTIIKSHLTKSKTWALNTIKGIFHPTQTINQLKH